MSFEEMRSVIQQTKHGVIAHETKRSIHVCLFCLILILSACVSTTVVDAILVQERNISGRLQYTEETEKLISQIDTWDGSGYKLSDTVFGQQYILDAVAAIDNRAYSNAVAAEMSAEANYALLQEEKRLVEAFYIPDLNLEYPDEGLYMSYDLQKFVYETCKEKDLDYWTVMGIIARESRFDNTVRGYSGGITYYGLMQMDWDVVESVRKWTGDYTLNPEDPYDNIVIGTTYLRYTIDKTGYEQGGVFAYGVGLGGYQSAVESGIYTDNATIKAYKYREMLYNKERYTATEARELGLI